MGLCSSCLKGTADDGVTPTIEARRRLQEEAAERRRQENENRGIKDPEKVRRLQQKAADLERLEREAAMQGNSGQNLRWTQD